jgi:RNA polymerase sigma-70 factor (ECF subfamily)
LDLLVRAQTGDSEAFRQLVDPYRRALHVHCYRILGSAQDAEDALQETLLAAWRGLGSFEGRASVRTWLYRIATSRCLDSLRAARRRPPEVDIPIFKIDPPEPNRLSEVVWLEPYPDVLLDGMIDARLGPEARLDAREAISLAFMTAVQQLSPRQRAVLILRDVLCFHASEVAEILEASEESVTSALKRARAALRDRLPTPGEPPPAPNSTIEQQIVEALTEAYESGDVDRIVALLTDDVVLGTPLGTQEYQGRAIAARFLTAVVFGNGRTYRLVPTRANGQPAFGLYVRDPLADIDHANGMLVLTLAGGQISVMTRFDNSVLALFGLPRTMASRR